MTRAHAIIRLERVLSILDTCLDQFRGGGVLRPTTIADLAVARYDLGELIPEVGELFRREYHRVTTSAGGVQVRP